MASTTADRPALSVRLAVLRRRAASGELRAVRDAARLSQAEIAADLGVPLPTFAAWERGEVRPRTADAIRYAEVIEDLEGVLAEHA